MIRTIHPRRGGGVVVHGARFAEAFADLPDVRHLTVGWDDPEGRESDVAE